MGWWSATVMGGDTPLDMLGEIMDLALGDGVYDGGNDEVLTAKVLNEKMDVIVEAFENSTYDSRIAWQVLGHEIVTRGAKLREDVKKRVLEAIAADEWAAEGDPERIKCMNDFRDTILAYKGRPVEVAQEGLFDRLAEVLAPKEKEAECSRCAGTGVEPKKKQKPKQKPKRKNPKPKRKNPKPKKKKKKAKR